MPTLRSLSALCALSLCVAAAHAQSTTTAKVSNLVAFSVSNPIGNVVRGADGAIYGVTAVSSTITSGVVYRAAVDGSTVSTLFQIPVDEALQPGGGLLLGSDGMLYGTTRFGRSGETSSTGTVFKISQTGTGFAVLHRFAASTGTNAGLSAINTDGAYPETELAEGADGYLYGVTTAGGPKGTGAIFKVSRDGTDFKLLHTFAEDTETTVSGKVVTVDGAEPKGQLVAGADGFLYGTASTGGANGRGTLFRISPDGAEFEVIYTFSATTADTTTGEFENADGAFPAAGLLDGNDGFFYGVTTSGGTNGYGVVFAVSPDGGTYTVLHTFEAPAGGARPSAELMLGSDGKLYGTTVSGGVDSSNATTSLGTIFSLDRDGTNFTRLHSFDGSVGYSPNSRLIQLASAEFVGTLGAGGECGYGALYRYSGQGTVFEGESSCGRSNDDGGGGATGPGLVLLLGGLAWRRRRRD